MPTARTENTTSKKASAAPAAAATADGPAAESLLTPGTILAERYRDTAYEALVGKNGENVSAVMSAGEAMLAGMAEVSQEMMTFAGNRLRDDVETAEDFAKTASPEELFEKQCSFARRAAQQYAEETSKLIAMMARIQQSCWQPMEDCTKAALQGLNGAEDKTKK
ncbi:MAG: phasin family protein [Kiloniellaceae bacterium]